MKTSSLALAVISLGCLMGPTVLASHEQRPGVEQEQWVNPGVGPAAPTDAVQFVRRTDGGFIGVLEKASAAFADSSRQEYLYTHLQFRVTEWLYNSPGRSSADRVDVLTPGGTYVDRGGQRVPTGNADIAKGLLVGHEYFVPVKYANNAKFSWNGQALLAAPDALSAVDGDKVTSVMPKSRWPQAIVQSVVVTVSKPGGPGSERQQFIGAIRQAAGRK